MSAVHCAIWKSFFNRFSGTPNDREPTYKECSCSAWNTARSSYQQYEQLGLYSSDMSVDDIMMDTLQNYAQPSKACTNIRFAEAYIPEDHEYHINRNEFNCWIFQNHFDCVASAIAGGINSVFNCPRGSSLFSTKEIVHALDVIHCHFATQELENIQNEYPDEDWDSIKQVLSKVVSGEYAEKVLEESSVVYYNNVIDEITTVSSTFEIYTSRLNRELYQLAQLRVLNVTTSFQRPDDVIKSFGIGLDAKRYKEYTYEQLQNFLEMENTAVLVDLPAHLGLVYAVGKDRTTGKYPHVLLSRPSGGQSPTGWIPWTLKDRYPGEALWEDEIEPDMKGVQEAVRTGKFSEEIIKGLLERDSGIAMELYPNGNLRTIYVITKVSDELDSRKIEYDSCFDDIAPIKCKTCCNDKEKGDSLNHWNTIKSQINSEIKI